MPRFEHFITSANGLEVVYDPVSSHAATHLADTPNLKGLTQGILAATTLTDEVHMFDTVMDEVVGESDLVENQEGDLIVYAKRPNRKIWTSFNMTQPPQPSSTVGICVERLQDASGDYRLVSAWIGSVAVPAFPGDRYETPDSRDFWKEHSLAWGRQEIQEGTRTAICPW